MPTPSTAVTRQPWATATAVALVPAGLLLWGCSHPAEPQPVPSAEPSAPATAAVELIQGDPATAGYYYAVRLTGFTPGATVPVVCRDTVTPDGFKTFTLPIASDGTAATDRQCYSGDGPLHWVTAAGLASNKITWDVQPTDPATTTTAATTTPAPRPTLTPRSPSPSPTPRRTENRSVQLAQGAPATFGYWYDVHLNGFPASTAVELVCRDSADPDGFKTFTVRTDDTGAARIAQACYSGDGPQHWITADGQTSNKVTW
ncbi:hypothetical protein AB0H83_29500 [Dactylosporangium sp. NPDC050688]|uniref:hypothetical protein n=1 Tax=Dactylosporangium sp. NPDC050688 TaxID=3157217 RepID=UPI0033E0FD5D